MSTANALAAFVGALPPAPALPPTHLPIAFPLAFPTPLHALNLLSTQHLLAHVLSHPSHAAYFAASPSRPGPGETATRGALSLHLASTSTDWADGGNLLGAAGWRALAATPERVAELFGLETHRERRHESLPVTVGEVDEGGQRVVLALTGTLRALGEGLPAACLGEAVAGAIEAGPARDVADSFCQKATALIPALADPYPLPPHILPSAPLRLLQDLSAHLARAPDPAVALPPPAELAPLSPLPLAPAPCIYYGLLDAPAHRAPADPLSPAAVLGPTEGGAGSAAAELVTVSPDEWAELARRSLDVCAAVGERTGMSAADVSRLFAALDEGMVRHGVGLAVATA